MNNANEYNTEFNKYQSDEWIQIQQEMEEDENSNSIMDEFKPKQKDLTDLFPEFTELKNLVQLVSGEIVAVFYEDYMQNEYFQTLADFKEWANTNIV
jgi:hypothetical protein